MDQFVKTPSDIGEKWKSIRLATDDLAISNGRIYRMVGCPAPYCGISVVDILTGKTSFLFQGKYTRYVPEYVTGLEIVKMADDIKRGEVSTEWPDPL